MSKPKCSIDGCEEFAQARGWCWSHYNKWRRHGDPVWVFKRRLCEVAGCSSASRVEKMCDKHYRRLRKHGDPNTGARPQHGSSCSADGCRKPHAQAGLCRSHYHRRWVDQGPGRELLAAASARRRALVSSSTEVERELTWRTFWLNGDRTCYLCGIECDDTDFRYFTDRNGAQRKIVGNTHPTLDHVVALVNGGTHTVSNAALACRLCNSRKHAKVNYESQHRSPE